MVEDPQGGQDFAEVEIEVVDVDLEIVIESVIPSVPSWNFSTLPAPSDSDYADVSQGNVTISIPTSNPPTLGSGGLSVLNDGVGQTSNNDYAGSYFNFWNEAAFLGVYPEGNLSWHHLWFLPYLLLFSLIWLPFFKYIKKYPTNRLINWFAYWLAKPWGVFVFCVPLILIEFGLEPYFPSTHALIGDWYLLVKYGFLFGLGFLMMHLKDSFWENLKKNRIQYLITALIAFGVLYVSVWQMEDTYFSYAIELIFIPINYWSWIITLLAYAAKYLNKSSIPLTYANEAVYPFYILHQTITIGIGYYIMNLDWSFLPKMFVMVTGTFMGSWIVYEFAIRRWKLTRPLFGLRLTNKHLK